MTQEHAKDVIFFIMNRAHNLAEEEYNLAHPTQPPIFGFCCLILTPSEMYKFKEATSVVFHKNKIKPENMCFQDLKIPNLGIVYLHEMEDEIYEP